MYEQICLATLPLYYALHRGYENAEATGFRLFRWSLCTPGQRSDSVVTSQKITFFLRSHFVKPMRASTMYLEPTRLRFNVGPASQPIAGSMPVNRLRRWPNTTPTLGPLYTLRGAAALLWGWRCSLPGARKATTQITWYIGPMLM